MGAYIERFVGRERQLEVLGPGGAQEYQTQNGRVAVRGALDAAEIFRHGAITKLVPQDTPVEIVLQDESKLRIAASYDQTDE